MKNKIDFILKQNWTFRPKIRPNPRTSEKIIVRWFHISIEKISLSRMIFNWWKFTAGCQKEDVEGASSLLLSTKKKHLFRHKTKKETKQNYPSDRSGMTFRL